jgi:hypothetical protein
MLLLFWKKSAALDFRIIMNLDSSFDSPGKVLHDTFPWQPILFLEPFQEVILFFSERHSGVLRLRGGFRHRYLDRILAICLTSLAGSVDLVALQIS